MTSKFLRLSLVTAVVVGLAVALPVAGFQPAENSRIAGLVFRAPELDVSELSAPSTSFSDATVRARVRAVALPGSVAQLDLRTGRFATLLTAVPLLPGKGVGNNLEASAEDLALRGKPAELGMRAWQALRPWLVANRAALGIDPAELVDVPRVTVIHPDYIQIHSPRRVAGLPVRGAFLSATIRYGNLVLLGTSSWGDLEEFAIPRLTELEASASLQRFVAPFDPGTAWKASELVWLPVATATTLAPSEIGAGIAYKLAWVVRGTFGEADGRYEALVDATDGTVLALEDTRRVRRHDPHDRRWRAAGVERRYRSRRNRAARLADAVLERVDARRRGDDRRRRQPPGLRRRLDLELALRAVHGDERQLRRGESLAAPAASTSASPPEPTA